MTASAGRPVHRVECSCGWIGYRLHPAGRDCPRCGADRHSLQAAWLAGCAPQRGRCCYLAHIHPAYRHASHYLGFTTNLPARWRDHLAGGYDPETRRNRGNGSRLIAAALHGGCTVELVRIWYGTQARTLEQRLKQRRKPGSLRAGARTSLKPLCPVCNPASAHRRYPNLPDPPQPGPTWHRFVHDPLTWDALTEWNHAFPELAYPAGGAS
jgi:predicted GIY-YIG superfamily endonuclease